MWVLSGPAGDERVPDGECADLLAILHVLGVERVAFGREGCARIKAA
ncbi:hypothetical protein [Edaphobacter aggregans]|nr:hypothetical protein [Edaphobacter aggregans]